MQPDCLNILKEALNRFVARRELGVDKTLLSRQDFIKELTALIEFHTGHNLMLQLADIPLDRRERQLPDEAEYGDDNCGC
jgi:hypothetical protein